MRSWSLEMEMQKESPRIPRVMKRYFSFVTVETLPHTLPLFLPSSLPACLRLSLLIPSSLPPSLPPTLSLSLPPSPPPAPPPSLALSLSEVKGSNTEGVTAFDFFLFPTQQYDAQENSETESTTSGNDKKRKRSSNNNNKNNKNKISNKKVRPSKVDIRSFVPLSFVSNLIPLCAETQSKTVLDQQTLDVLNSCAVDDAKPKLSLLQYFGTKYWFCLILLCPIELFLASSFQFSPHNLSYRLLLPQVCESSERSDAIILCKTCQYGFHVDTCLTVPLDESYDPDTWKCAACLLPPTYCQVTIILNFLSQMIQYYSKKDKIDKFKTLKLL